MKGEVPESIGNLTHLKYLFATGLIQQEQKSCAVAHADVCTQGPVIEHAQRHIAAFTGKLEELGSAVRNRLPTATQQIALMKLSSLTQEAEKQQVFWTIT